MLSAYLRPISSSGMMNRILPIHESGCPLTHDQNKAKTQTLWYSVAVPGWRNWQTRWTQNPVAARPCRFDSYARHHNPLKRSLIAAIFPVCQDAKHCYQLLPITPKTCYTMTHADTSGQYENR